MMKLNKQSPKFPAENKWHFWNPWASRSRTRVMYNSVLLRRLNYAFKWWRQLKSQLPLSFNIRLRSGPERSSSEANGVIYFPLQTSVGMTVHVYKRTTLDAYLQLCTYYILHKCNACIILLFSPYGSSFEPSSCRRSSTVKAPLEM